MEPRRDVPPSGVRYAEGRLEILVEKGADGDPEDPDESVSDHPDDEPVRGVRTRRCSRHRRIVRDLHRAGVATCHNLSRTRPQPPYSHRPQDTDSHEDAHDHEHHRTPDDPRSDESTPPPP